MKEFIKYYKPHKLLFFLDLICAFLISASDLIFPMVTRKFINDFIPNRNLRSIIIFAIILLVLYLFRLFLDYFVGYWGHVLGVRMEYDMRKELYSHIQKMSFSYFDETKTGQLMSRVTNDLNEISELAHHGPEDLFISTIMLIGSFILMLSINVKLTIALFTVIPFLIWFALSYNLKMRNSFSRYRVILGDINARLEDSISGIRVVKSFTNEEHEEKKFDEGNHNFKLIRSETVKYIGIFSGGINFFSNILNLIALAFGGYLVYKGEITFADFTAFLLFMGLMISPVKRLAQFVEQFQRGMAGFNRFIEVKQIKPQIIDSPNAINMGQAKGKIEFDNVNFSYTEDTENVLKNINLSVKPGETVALVGPSGAGKTTLCSLIPRYYEVNSGKISVDDMDIKDVTLNSLRKNIGMVQQDVFLFSGTIFDNILYGNLDATKEEVYEAAKKANAHEFILATENGYDTYLGERGVKLSGGQKQRISIARMFLKNPSILILDEATSSLDNKSEAVIQESIEKLAKGRTTFIIAHRLATIRKAKRIVVLTEKGIEEEGSHEELLNKKGVYYNLYNSQFWLILNKSK